MEYSSWKRLLFVLLAHLAFAIMYMQRLNLSIALVAMVGSGSQTNVTNERNEQNAIRVKQFDWDEAQQGMVLSAFFYGYFLLNLPAGVLVNKYGGKVVCGVGLMMSSLLTLLTPIAALTSFSVLMVVRVCIGLAQGVILPSVLSLLGEWSPTGGKDRMVAFAIAGSEIGAVITFFLGGVLCASKFLDGWPTVFHIFGVLGIVWFVAWTASIPEATQSDSLPRDEEEDSEETRYLQPSMNGGKKKNEVPWTKILLSVPFWATIVGTFCQDWIWFFIITDLPLYYKKVLGISVMEDGLFSTLPIIVAFLTNIVSGFLSDYLQQYWSVKSTRKFTASIGFFPTALLFIVVSYTTEGENALAIMYMTLCAGVWGLSKVTFFSNIIDLSPTFTGILMGIVTGITGTAGIGAPMVTGFFTNHDPSRENYRVVFFINAGICVVGGLFFCAFGSGDVQDWDPASKNEEDIIYENKQQKYS